MELEAAVRQALPGARVSALAPDLDAYARDLWPRWLVALQIGAPEPARPRCVVWPESVEHVVRLVTLARELGFSLVPFGAGSGVCGGIHPDRESVVVDLKRFSSRRVLPGPELDAGAGVLGIQLEEELLEQGYTTGHYPSSILISTVGGWVAARSAGQCSGRYGKIEDMVTGLEVVLGTGDVVRTRRRPHGTDLVPLFVGSEGTLGIVTRVGLRLHAAPSERRFASYSFETLEAGVTALRLMFQSGLRPAVARLYDPLDTLLMADDPRVSEARGARRDGPRRTPGLKGAALRGVLRAPALIARALAAAESSVLRRAALILVHEGEAPEVDREAARAARVCAEARGVPLGEGPARAWYAHRYSVSYRQSPVFRDGLFSDTMEVAAPWSRLLGVYHAVRAALGEHVLVMAHLSHSYPDGGSIYFTFAGTAHAGASALEVYDRAWRAALSAAIDAGAALSHHHGVGRSKAPRLGEELGSAIRVVRDLKRAWDPDGVLNPGALLPEPSAVEALEPPEPARIPALDAESCLVELPGSTTIRDAAAWVEARGHALPLEPAAISEHAALDLDAWLARGMPGARDRFADPVLAPLAGFSARLHSGRRFRVAAAPRRAVGPDLSALFVGAASLFGHVESATLVALRRDAPAPAPMSFHFEPEPRLNDSEDEALDLAVDTLVRPGDHE